MAKNNEERPIRLRPRRSKGNPNDDPRRYVGVVGSVLRFAQMAKHPRLSRSNRSQSQADSGWRSRSPRLYSQRVAVRVTYAKNKNPGQWKAHGHYIARDTATQGGDPSRAGFDAIRTDVNIAATLDTWQRAGDERIFKIIVSPEFGERLNLLDQTRKLLARMEKDLGTHLEWVAATHFNTEHPHVHIALLGRDQIGSSLRLERDYIRFGIRFHVENLATEALGFRTERDAQEAQDREITQNRYTTLDRIIQRSNDAQSSSFVITTGITRQGLSERERTLQQNLSARLAHLENMGLAQPVAPQQWAVRSDFESVLRTLQRTHDRQKMLAAHGALSSDPRLPFEIANVRKLRMVEGRVLLHAEDEGSGRRYLLLEGIDAKVHLIYHTDSIEEARRAGKLAVNNFVRFEKRFVERNPQIEISDYGDANALLENRQFFKKQARLSLRRGIVQDQNTWGGWLGQYYARLGASIGTERVPTRVQKDTHQHSRA
jgi:type IV secretory pathway VirD2 relaxase